MKATSIAVLLSATMLCTPAALAQAGAVAPVMQESSANPTQQPAVSGDETAGADIVVTAQRRSESLQRVPVSVTAVTAETLQSRNLNDLTQVARAAPTLQVGQDNTFAVRGVGTLSFAGTVDSSVALAIDEVNLGRPLLNSPLLNDLARVEVLNGPQGLLFGKNASAGLLNIVTARPVIGEYSDSANIELAQRDTPGAERVAPSVIVRDTMNIPVSENSALRVSGLYSYQEPGTTYVGTPKLGTRHDLNLQTFSIKGKYLARLGKLEVYLIGDYNENHGIAGIFDTSYRQVSPNGGNVAPLAADGIVAGTENLKFGGEGDQFRDIATGGAQGKLTYAFDSGIEISNLFAWRFYTQDQSSDTDFTSRNGLSLNATQARYDQYSNEFRVALPESNRLSGQAGLYYFKSRLDLARQQAGNSYLSDAAAAAYPFCVGVVAVPGARPPGCAVSNVAQIGSDLAYVLDTESYAAFGQATFNVTDAFKLTAGGRLTRDEIELNETQNQRNYYSTLAGPRGTFAASYGNTDFSWKLGAQYQATSTIMAYGFYGRGYKGPGFNDSFPTATANVVVQPEHSNTAEIGIKTSFLDRRVTFNVSAFHTKFDNFQVQSFNPTSVSFQVQNAAQVTSKGIEANVTLLPIRGLTITGAGSLLSSKFDSFPGAQCYPTQTTKGCSATVSVFDAAGQTLPGAPRFTSTVGVAYRFGMIGTVQPFVQGDWYHRSSINYQVSGVPGATFGRLDLFGASLGAEVGGIRVAVFCKNCTNKLYPTSIQVDSGDANLRNGRGQAIPALSFTQQNGLDSVRTIGVNLGFKF